MPCSCQIYLQATNGYSKFDAAAPRLTAGEQTVAAFLLDSCVVESMKLTKPRGIWCALPLNCIFGGGICRGLKHTTAAFVSQRKKNQDKNKNTPTTLKEIDERIRCSTGLTVNVDGQGLLTWHTT